MSSTLQNLMCPKSNAEVAEVMFRTNPRKYWRQYVNALEDEVAALEKQLAEKDAMIDWLLNSRKCKTHMQHFAMQGVCLATKDNLNIKPCGILGSSYYTQDECADLWRKAAQAAVKKK